MSAKHPYEKHLAEKLVQLPPPGDPDQNWQQMKSLLDKDMPRGGGRGGPGGAYRWWGAGAIVVAVVVGTWFWGKQVSIKQQNEVVAGTIKSVPANHSPANAPHNNGASQSATATLPNNGTGNAEAAATVTDPKGATYAAVADEQAAGEATAATGANPVSDKKENRVVTPSANQADDAATTVNEKSAKARSSTVPANEAGAPVVTDAKSPITNNNNKTNRDRNKIYSDNNSTVTENGAATTDNSAVAASNKAATTGNKKTHGNVHRNTANNQVATTGANKRYKKATGNKEKAGKENNSPQPDYTYKPVISQPSQPSGAGLTASPVNISVNYTGSVAIAPSELITREFTYYTQADLFPDSDKNATAASAHKKSKSNAFSNEDKGFVFGLSLPLGFPLGDQQAISLNRNGRMNTLSDYIPSPHIQYHINNKLYLQTQVQLSAPQFIHPILLEEKEKQLQANMEVINTTYARKLYYFNLPVSIHYSPLRDFYIGTGLQFSSLVSGVAQCQQIKRIYPIGTNGPSGVRPPSEYIVSNYYTKFKKDSLSGKFNKNELRLLIDMNYYWNRFTVGLQYNQAFNNYISFRVNTASAYTFDKNKGLQFYLRYNIWEDKKRRNNKDKEILTLK